MPSQCNCRPYILPSFFPTHFPCPPLPPPFAFGVLSCPAALLSMANFRSQFVDNAGDRTPLLDSDSFTFFLSSRDNRHGAAPYHTHTRAASGDASQHASAHTSPAHDYPNDYLDPNVDDADANMNDFNHNPGDASHANSYPAQYSRYNQSDYSLPPPPLPPKNGSSDVNIEQHELSDLANPFREQRPTNPFDEPEPALTGPYTYNRYPALQRSLSSDFNHTSDTAYHSGMYSDFPGEKDVDSWQRQNERNRIKLQKRLPRFHFTKLPWFTMVATLVQVAVFIAELARMGELTGSPIMTKPYFNPMIGPSPYLLINMGARYVPCMHRLTNITTDTSINYPCPNSTSAENSVCNLSELCGLQGVPIVDGEFVPNQWYRVITPIFLHAGFLHIIFNMLLQLTMGASVERQIGWLKYSIIYMASGIAGFLLGANFSPDGIASTGASGALFGIIATNLLLFVFSGTKNTNMYGTKRYKLFVAILVCEILVSIVLGLLPGLDNFSHIGGFCMGLLLSIVLLPDPSQVYIDGIYTYEPDTRTWQLFLNNWNPMNNWNHKVQWKVLLWLGLRVVCLVLAVVFFAMLFKNLYAKDMQDESNKCTWCKYINCIPVHDWCDQGEITVSTESDSGDASSSSSSSSSSAVASATTSGTPLPTSIENPNTKRENAFDIFRQGPRLNGSTLQHPYYIVPMIAMVALGMLLFWRCLRSRKTRN